VLSAKKETRLRRLPTLLEAGGANLSPLAVRAKPGATLAAPGRNEKAAHLRAAFKSHL
jgi:hypothetical protein